MHWIKEMQNAIGYIENRLLDELDIEDIAKSANSSLANFQRIFSIITGMTVGEYIRSRRLSLAAQEMIKSERKALDIALKYGYETAESFTKAFSRFHGATPSDVMRRNANASYFAPLAINVDIRGGFNMSRKIIPNIPVIDYYGNEVDYIINILEATFAVTGEKTDKAELSAYSGMGNRFVWQPGVWTRGNESMNSINEAPYEAEVRLLKAIGWAAKFIIIHRDKDGNLLNMDNEQIRQDFVAAIDKGYPVLYLAAGTHRYNIVIGYEDSGRKIICKEAVETTAVHVDSETVVHDDWENSILEYVLLKEKRELAPERERALDLFKLVVSLACKTDEINGKKIGFNAWQAYLHDLESADFSALSADEVGIEGRMGVYCDGLCQIYGRKEALPYYRSLAEKFPEWQSELMIAIEALDECADYGGFIWKHVPGVTGGETFRDPAVRKVLADEGRRAMGKEAEAIEQFVRILEKEGV
ncbi:MAG: AraC family transcriptional regulator [Oscillospiraceae bacterium]|nr:AraC family transcriptional regulator [Oscillospiraceae bacterium]